MAKRNKYRAKYLRWHKSYEKRAVKELRKVFIAYGKSIDLNDARVGEIDMYLKKQLDIDILWKAYFKIYTQIGMVHKKRVLKGLNLDKKALPIHDDLTSFEKNVVKYLMKFAGERIVSVHSSYISTIRKIITKEIAKEWTLYDVADTLLKDLISAGLFDKRKMPWEKQNFYRWQSERIARTESTASSNWAALQAADDTGFVMEKEWLSARDSRTREHEAGDDWDHVDMDYQKVPRFGKFETEGANGEKEYLDYPGDPTGSAGNVINCRCTVALIAKRDENGNLIPTF